MKKERKQLSKINDLMSHHGEKLSKENAARFLAFGVDTSKIVDSNQFSPKKETIQISVNNYNAKTRQGLREKIRELKDSLSDRIKSINHLTDDSIAYFYKKYGKIRDSIKIYSNARYDKAQDSISDLYSATRDTKMEYRQNNNHRNIFPAFYPHESQLFFTEKDTLASKFFANNSLLYSSSLQKLTYSSEAYADYFGPVRLGLGYTITSSSNTSGNSSTSSNSISNIIANGGNLNYNVSYPLLALTNWEVLKIKAYFSSNGGVDIPKDSTNVASYGYLSTTGIVMNAYSTGDLGEIQLFYTSRLSYVIGNKNFEKQAMQNSFFLWQNSFGVAVKNNFRVRLDVYSGLSGHDNHQFVKSNFPVTLSFDVINPF